MLPIPKGFTIPNGAEVDIKLVENGNFYEFVEPQKELSILVKIFHLI